ncbi:7130_t:CDS:2 [Funneliformis geosporum]|uniref:17573_t:CDS:1 n=1 Tax=Funneliformis geosporum TaxID=1117311 RepID=A0A9W4SJT5_9GLOM|nr:17573_t:CDS:2 [Funneliformis geosporum]CAI2187411.1 7130_t:CDS:2 [Funneliformis geosporum]
MPPISKKKLRDAEQSPSIIDIKSSLPTDPSSDKLPFIKNAETNVEDNEKFATSDIARGVLHVKQMRTVGFNGNFD